MAWWMAAIAAAQAASKSGGSATAGGPTSFKTGDTVIGGFNVPAYPFSPDQPIPEYPVYRDTSNDNLIMAGAAGLLLLAVLKKG